MNQNHWILDVLVDLRSFAAANDLEALADHLDETLVIAKAELVSLNDTAGARTNGEQIKLGQDPEDTGGNQYT